MQRHHKKRRTLVYGRAKYTYRYIMQRFSQGDSGVTTRFIASPRVWDAIEKACAYMDVYFDRKVIDTYDDSVPPSQQYAMQITFKEHSYAIINKS